jgi:hypothetical protein
MLWCLNEAEVQDVQDHLREAVVMMISRDERASRLHVRFRCADEDGHLRIGFLGQARGHNPDSISITNATNQVLKNACTRYRNPPAGAKVIGRWRNTV